MKQLIQIQSELKVPKSQYNSFGKYYYRNAEEILEAVKPLLVKYSCTLTISDKVNNLNGLTFIEATATISNGTETVSVSAQAGIETSQKGMSIAQSFGSSSSYARKYALNGLFLIDDTKDPDTGNNGKETPENKPEPEPTQAQRNEVIKLLSKLPEEQRGAGVVKINKAKTMAELEEMKAKLLAL